MFAYHNPVRIVFDTTFESALSSLAPEGEILLIVSASLARRGIVERVRAHANIMQVVDFVVPNPELDALQNLKASLGQYRAILAIGGGSVIDTAKFLSVRGDVAVQNDSLEIRNLAGSAPIFAFPSTAGSGSELTPWATIWDKACGRKYSLHDSCLFPHTAFYVPELTLSLPLLPSVHSALDSLSHAFESVWNKNANPIATMHALESIRLTLENLPILAQNLHDIHARTMQMRASMHAALAFCSTQTALAHAISYPLTMHLGLPHGLACSFTLPLLLRHCEESARQLLAPFQSRLERLFETLHIATNPSDYGITKDFADAIFQNLNARAQNARLDVGAVYHEFISFCK
ncbi:MAG: iron-containing alcohol dehydrogenase [Helicobacter sp.]|nr:iron-containing alcohol dehydrogenase [Helicobacter sp.]